MCLVCGSRDKTRHLRTACCGAVRGMCRGPPRKHTSSRWLCLPLFTPQLQHAVIHPQAPSLRLRLRSDSVSYFQRCSRSQNFSVGSFFYS